METLKFKHMPTPSVDTFKSTEIEFYEKWNFPNCVGSIDCDVQKIPGVCILIINNITQLL